MLRNWNLCALLVGLRSGLTAMESSTVSPRKIKNRTHSDPVFPLRGVYPKGYTGSRRDICTLEVTAALFTVAERWKQL